GLRSESVGGYGIGPSTTISHINNNIFINNSNNPTTTTTATTAIAGGEARGGLGAAALLREGGGGQPSRNVLAPPEGGSATTSSMLGSGGTTPMIRSTTSGPILTPATDLSGYGTSAHSHSHDAPEHQLDELNEKLRKEIKMKEGAENLLQVLDTKKPKESKTARIQAQRELTIANFNIQQIQNQIHAIKRPRASLNFPRNVVRQKSVRLAGFGLVGG